MREAWHIKAEIGFYVLLLLLCLAVYVDASGYPAAIREPVGSAFMPKCMAVFIGLFSLALLARTVKELTALEGRSPLRETPTGFKPRYTLAVRSLIILFSYATLLNSFTLPSEILSPLFLFVFIMSLAKRSMGRVIAAAVISVAFGTGLTFLFKNYLYVFLP